jgi:putative Holliday junction resolvase
MKANDRRFKRRMKVPSPEWSGAQLSGRTFLREDRFSAGRERLFCLGVTDTELPSSGSVLGVDYGTVRIGLAVGELGSGLVLPLPVLANPGSFEATVERIAETARVREAAIVVLGNPVHMSGEESPMSAQVRKLKTALEAHMPIPVVLRDERLSSVQAEEQLKDAGLRWWQYEKGRIDTLAAMNLVRELLVEIKPELGRLNEASHEPPAPERRGRAQRRQDARKNNKRRRGFES